MNNNNYNNNKDYGFIDPLEAIVAIMVRFPVTPGYMLRCPWTKPCSMDIFLTFYYKVNTSYMRNYHKKFYQTDAEGVQLGDWISIFTLPSCCCGPLEMLMGPEPDLYWLPEHKGIKITVTERETGREGGRSGEKEEDRMQSR